ncbi:MAG TPA: CD225/dispanin family protein [Tepidisphaeraceae bacterium]|nr:CD225/dispanin family protein [Tepidisphaeraceae bacterium]
MTQSKPDNAAPDVLEYSGLAPARPPVKTYLGHSIFALIIFWPLGLPALINSVRAERARKAGHADAAALHASRAVAFGMGALAAAVITLLVGCLLSGWMSGPRF